MEKKLIFLLYKIEVPIKEIVRRTKRGKSTTRHLLAVMSCHLMPNIKNILNSKGRRRHSLTAFSSYPSSTQTLHIDMWWYTNPLLIYTMQHKQLAFTKEHKSCSEVLWSNETSFQLVTFHKLCVWVLPQM